MKICISIILLILSTQLLSSKQIYIKDLSSSDFIAIINKANPNDTIYVDSGELIAESIVLRKPITLIGINNPIITGMGSDHIFKIFGNDIIVKGFTIQKTGFSFIQDRAAIKLDSAHNCRIENNTILNCMFAVYAARSNNLFILRNVIKAEGKSQSSSGNGVHLWYSKDIKVEYNNISGHRDGIYLEFTEKVKINNNISVQNKRYGLHFMFSHNSEYIHNTFRNNGSGVAVMYTSNVLMQNNVFEDNMGAASYGLLLKDIKDSKIINNKIINNSTGIYIEGGGNNIFSNNLIKKNAWAIRLLASSEQNTFQKNNFIANSFDLTTNSTTSSNTFLGNYWDKYSGYDLDKNGKGDVPYYPVRLFAYIVEKNPPLIILLNSFFVFVLDLAENIIPSITPAAMIDNTPLIIPANDYI